MCVAMLATLCARCLSKLLRPAAYGSFVISPAIGILLHLTTPFGALATAVSPVCSTLYNFRIASVYSLAFPSKDLPLLSAKPVTASGMCSTVYLNQTDLTMGIAVQSETHCLSTRCARDLVNIVGVTNGATKCSSCRRRHLGFPS